MRLVRDTALRGSTLPNIRRPFRLPQAAFRPRLWPANCSGRAGRQPGGFCLCPPSLPRPSPPRLFNVCGGGRGGPSAIALTHTALQSFTAHVRNASGENEKCHFFGDRFFGNPHLELGPLVSSGSSSPISANTRSKGSEWGQKIEDRQKYLRHAKCWWHLFRFCSTYLSPMFPCCGLLLMT